MLLCSRTTQLQSFTTTKAYYFFFWSSYISIMGQPALRLVEQSLYRASCGSGKENKRMLVSKVPAQIPSADTLLAVTSHMTKSVVCGTGNHNLLWVRQSVEGRGRTRGGQVFWITTHFSCISSSSHQAGPLWNQLFHKTIWTNAQR